ncbi:AI-2E family transporter [Myxacorys almedinensis]|uniref:AI-2E family transporter n=1 Tax=Myxacorys almedinensis A TaxID=2690445 RepID=A0A8J7Z090_9CYAN|nr:AI-2E family transporter [Myxacorys almedinensis A]
MGLGKWIGLVVFVASLYIIWQIRQILLLIFAAVVLATALDRLVRLLQRIGIKKRGIAIALTLVLLLALGAGFLVIIVPPFVDQFQQLINFIPTGFDLARQWVEWLQDRLTQQSVPFDGLDGLTQQLQSFVSQQVGNLFTLFSDLLGIVVRALFVLVLSIMLLANPTIYRQGFVLLFPSFYRRRANNILEQCNVSLGGWATGILFNMTVIALFSGIGLWILQVPLALANAVLAGLLTFIPNVGPTLSVIPPIALALLDAPWKVVAILILYIVIQQLESNVLTPLVMEKQVSLPPAVTLASQVIFASFFGFLGLFLALPLMVVLQVWIKELLVKDILNDWQNPEFANSVADNVSDQGDRDIDQHPEKP